MELGTGGKMISNAYADDMSSEFYYVYYYDQNTHQKITAVSKMDEKNLKQIASDLKIDYIQQQNYDSQTTEEKISSYQDIYYYFAIPLVILLIVDFVLKKRRM